jgi:raffinose/stachyose/melibiose transport system permease protein
MRNSKSYHIVGFIVCLLATAFFMFPLAIMVTRSFMKGGLSNYLKVFDKYNLSANFLTSLITVSFSMVIVAFVVSFAAFAFSKLSFAGNKVIYYTLLGGMMVPAAATIYPLFQIVKSLGLISSPFSLVFPYATGSCCFNLMILKNYYDDVPDEMLEAAYMDGASKLMCCVKVVMPVAKPGLAVVLMQTFLSCWNEVQMARVFISNTKVQPLSVIPIRFSQTISSRGFTQEVMYAALVICIVPVIVFYAFAARSLISGLTTGAVKG